MKRVWAMILALMLVGCAVGCSAKPTAPLVSHTVQTAAPQSDSVVQETEAAENYVRGEWNGRTYTSTYAGISLTLPNENWSIEPEEDETEDSFTELMVQNEQTGASVILMWEKAPQETTVAEYAKAIEQGLSQSEDVAYTVGESADVQLCGNAYRMVTAQAEEYGMEQAYLMRSRGERMAVVILTASIEEGVSSLLELFDEKAP